VHNSLEVNEYLVKAKSQKQRNISHDAVIPISVCFGSFRLRVSQSIIAIGKCPIRTWVLF